VIGLDTNVLVRYIVRDDPVQAAVASDFMKQYVSDHSPGFISWVVITELAWVLKRSFGYSKREICRALYQVLSTTSLLVERSDRVLEALYLYEHGPAGFSDYLIGLRHRDEGCMFTVTFDAKASRSVLFSLLPEQDLD